MKKRTIFLLSSILLLGGLSVGTLSSCGDQLVEKDSIYTISASVNDDSLGKITLEKTTGTVGEVVKFSIDITPGSDAFVKELKINGSSVDVSTRQFTPRKGTNSVVATLAVNTPVVETGTVVIDTKIVNGTVTADKTSGIVGDTINLTITPDSGFKLETLKANNLDLVVENNKASFTLVEGENLVTATFVVDQVEPPVQKVDTFYFSDLNGWNGWGSEARVYLFNEDGPVGTAWPGVEMTQINYGAVGEGINLYKVEDLNYTRATHIVFSTGYIDSNTETYSAQHQTIDIDLTAEGENNYYQLTEEINTDAGSRGQGTWLDFATYEETITGTVVLPSDLENGTVSASKLSGYRNDQVELTVTPDENYELDYLRVDNVDLVVTENQAAFTLKEGNNVITASFKEILPPVETGTVVIDEEIANGVVSADKLTGNVGDIVTLTVTPNDGYDLESLKANNEVLTVTDNQATFTLVKGENFVTATFKETVVEPPVQQVETFYFSDLNGWNYVGNHAWVYLYNDEGVVGEAWPGTELTQINYGAVADGVNLYVVEDLDYTGATHMVFSTGYQNETDGKVAQHQTIDIDLTTRGENNYYQLTEEITTESGNRGQGSWLNFATYEETITGTVVLPTEVANGTISADKLSGYRNDQVTLTLTPNENYEVDYVKVNDGENLTVVDNKATFALASGVNTVSVAFKEAEQVIPDPDENLKELYVKVPSWWAADVSMTNIQTFYENTDLGPINGSLGEPMEYLSTNKVEKFNYYKTTIDLDEVGYVKFIRTGNSDGVVKHWGAETVMYNINNLGDNDMLIIEDNAKWSGDGNYANLEAGVYDPSSDPQPPEVPDYGTYTIYFDPNGVWNEETIYAYAFGDNGDNATWPGVIMEKVEGTNYFKVEIDSLEFQTIIFNNGTAQTADIEIDFTFGNDASVVATLNADARTVTWSLYTA